MNNNLDRQELKNAYFLHILSSITSEITHAPKDLVSSLNEKLGVSYESVLECANDPLTPNSLAKNVLKGLVNTVEDGVESYYDNRIIRHNGIVPNLSLEAAMEELDTENGGSTLATVISDFLSTLQNFSPAQIKDMSKVVLDIEKENQDQEKQRELGSDEDDDIDTNEDTDPFGEGDNDESQEESNGSDDTEDGNNNQDPFGDTSGNDSGNAESEDGDNPFGDGGSSSNPFDDEGETSEDENKENKGKGSEENGDEDKNGDDSQAFADDTTTKNAFESVQEIGDIKVGGIGVFAGLVNGDIRKFCVTSADTLYKKEMQSIFETVGVESAEYTNLAKAYKKSSTALFNTAVGVLSVNRLLGINMNMDVIKYPELFMED